MTAGTELDLLAARAAARWQVSARRVRRDLHMAGSPDRCELRLVIESEDGRLYLLESLFEEDAGHKKEIAFCLDLFSEKGLSEIVPYRQSAAGGHIARSGGRLWQLSDYVCGVPLNRPEYVRDGWRGDVLADFLIRQHAASREIPYLKTLPVFSITDYIQKLVTQMRVHDPQVLDGIGNVVRRIEKRFVKLHDRLPNVFCHGDFHPLNIIWTPRGIGAVIDWEFLGIKPEIYDAANLIGCIGVEEPRALTGDLVLRFVRRLKQCGWISGAGWEALIDFVIAMRFAWLSEWLRHRDREMIALETTYMNLLTDHADALQDALIPKKMNGKVPDETMHQLRR